MWRRTGLAAATRGIDYSGALLNYVLVAAAVFGGRCKGSQGEQEACSSTVEFHGMPFNCYIDPVEEWAYVQLGVTRSGGSTL